ncbi:hypothetical protein [Stenotrophomonas phage RAS14]
MDNKKYLRSCVDAMIAGDSEAANTAFTKYITPKALDVLSEAVKNKNLDKALEKVDDRAPKGQKKNLKKVEDEAEKCV